MKKLVFIFLFICFISVISICTIKADTIPQLVSRIDYCYIASGSLYSNSSLTYVHVYELPNYGSSSEYSFVFSSGNRLRAIATDQLLSNCGNIDNNNSEYKFDNNNPVVGNTYSFSTSKRYIYLYLHGSPGSQGSVTWNSVEVVESDPTIPHITILDQDFYLFYDFDTISDFDILSSYTFTNFTDFEKLVIVMLFNIFYLGFIFACIYIILKALYKLVSWVFR
jgi:hypothetical protein